MKRKLQIWSVHQFVQWYSRPPSIDYGLRYIFLFCFTTLESYIPLKLALTSESGHIAHCPRMPMHCHPNVLLPLQLWVKTIASIGVRFIHTDTNRFANRSKNRSVRFRWFSPRRRRDMSHSFLIWSRGVNQEMAYCEEKRENRHGLTRRVKGLF